MSYNWQNGEVITAEKLNQTGGGLIKVASVICYAALSQSIETNTKAVIECNSFYNNDPFEELSELPEHDFAIVTMANVGSKNLALQGFTFDKAYGYNMYVINNSGSTVSITPQSVQMTADLYKIG